MGIELKKIKVILEKKLHQPVTLDGSSLTIEEVAAIARDKVRVEISDSAVEKVEEGRRAIARLLASGKSVYGVNTGFGRLADKKIGSKDLGSLQVNLIRSHALGTGKSLSEDEARAIMAVRLNTLLRGYSGIRTEVANQIATYLNEDLPPEIPCHGSLGASGDLAPSAHIALTLIGEGYFILKGERVPAKTELRKRRIRPIKLKEKEGLAIINGTQVMTGLGSLLVEDAINLLSLLDLAAALSLEALGGNISEFDARVHALRPFRGQESVAERIREAVKGSGLIGSAHRVQDPYSLRCVPQVHGAFWDTLDHARLVVQTEINSVTDNPLVFPDDDSLISAGNFHGQPVAIVLDFLCIALAEASTISERRIDKLLSGANPKLPLFLTRESGLNSGLMVTQYTAAALVAQNKVLASPASIDSATVSAGQEDHSSMGVTAALKCREVLENALKVVALEMMCASQAIDLLGDARLGRGTKLAFELIRKQTEKVDKDRVLAGDLEKLYKFLGTGALIDKVLRAVDSD